MNRGIRTLCAVLSLGGLLTACSSTPPPAAPQLPTWTNSIGMVFVEIPAGTFKMGASEDERARLDEKPRHDVTISRAFYMGKYEVTQEQWTAVMGSNPSKTQKKGYPVESVSWDEIQTFIQRLNKKEGTGKYRLPTEAEWEYAARAGTETPFSFPGNGRAFKAYACADYAGRTSGMRCSPADTQCQADAAKQKIDTTTCAVGSKKPNPWGLHDVHGSVWEWVQDRYDETYYQVSETKDPTGPKSGEDRVMRGGGWHSSTGLMRSANRGHKPSDYRNDRIGFRLAFTAGAK